MSDKKSKFKSWMMLIPYIIAAASAVAAVTPNDTDDIIIDSIKKIANIVALNVMHAGQ